MTFHSASPLNLFGSRRPGALPCVSDRLRRLARTVAGLVLAAASLMLLSQPAAAQAFLTSITVAAGSYSLTVGGPTTTLIVTGNFSDNSHQDVTASSTFHANTAGVVTLSSNVVTGVAAGTTTISANYIESSAVTAPITVSAASTNSYQYTGKRFTTFSCGPVADCPTPAPGNIYTSYSTSNIVTATLTLSTPLLPSTVYPNFSGDAAFRLTLSDGVQTVTSQYGGAACLATDAAGKITTWFLRLFVGGEGPPIYSRNDPTFALLCEGAGGAGVEDYGQSASLVGDYLNYGYDTNAPGAFSPPYPTQSIAASRCTAPQTCNLTNGVLTFQIRGTDAALAIINGSNFTVTDELCVVPKDPRGKNCGARHRSDEDGEEQNPRPLNVSDVCPGFGKTVIPDYLCGASGPSGTGFALIRSVAEEVDSLNGILVDYLAEPGAIPALQSPNNPKCPVNGVGDGVGALGYRTDSLVEEVTPEGPLLLEMTYACDEHKSAGPKTIQSAGLKLHLNNSEKFDGDTGRNRLVSFANYKYRNLKTVVNDIPSNSSTQALTRCIKFSQQFLNNGNPSGPACAAEQAWQCDAFVEAHAGDFQQSFSPLRLPDPYGDIRRRLGNLYYTEFVRISRQLPPTDWRPADPGICTPLAF